MISESKFGTWSPAASPVSIDYSLTVIEEIRTVVADGFQKIARGMEVGGVLYGTHEDRTIRVLGMGSMQCEYVFGPSFRLSENDQQALREQLSAAPTEPKLNGLEVVGWFVSHPRAELAMQPDDTAIYDEYFNQPHQVTLVIRPGRANTMRAGFFVRDDDGTVHSDRSYEDFNFPDRLAALFERRPEQRPEARAAGASASQAIEMPIRPAGQTPPAVPGRDARLRQLRLPAETEEQNLVLASDYRSFGEPPPLSPSSKKGISRFLWGGVIVIAALAAYASIKPLSQAARLDPLGLTVLDKQGQLQIQWNNKSSSIAGAADALLVVIDGTEHKSLALDAKLLNQGSVTYSRITGDVEVRLKVNRGSGEKAIEEASRFLGSAPPAVIAITETPEPAKSSDDQQLRDDYERQRARIQQLERTLTIMRGRLGAEQEK